MSDRDSMKAVALPRWPEPMPDSTIHLTAGIIGEAGSVLSRTRAALAPAKPVLRILDKADQLAKLAAKR